MASITALAPTVESIFRIRGQRGKAVRNVTIRGLTLTVANTPLVAGGFWSRQIPRHRRTDSPAENCRLMDLEIKNVGGQGIRAWNLKSCVIENCHVHDTGACGLKFGRRVHRAQQSRSPRRTNLSQRDRRLGRRKRRPDVPYRTQYRP